MYSQTTYTHIIAVSSSLSQIHTVPSLSLEHTLTLLHHVNVFFTFHQSHKAKQHPPPQYKIQIESHIVFVFIVQSHSLVNNRCYDSWLIETLTFNFVFLFFVILVGNVVFVCKVTCTTTNVCVSLSAETITMTLRTRSFMVKVQRAKLSACFTCLLCDKLFRNATTISECLHTCKCWFFVFLIIIIIHIPLFPLLLCHLQFCLQSPLLKIMICMWFCMQSAL